MCIHHLDVLAKDGAIAAFFKYIFAMATCSVVRVILKVLSTSLSLRICRLK